jgi:hypothetical protein
MVSHGMFLRAFTGEGWDPVEKLAINAKYINNA